MRTHPNIRLVIGDLLQLARFLAVYWINISTDSYSVLYLRTVNSVWEHSVWSVLNAVLFLPTTLRGQRLGNETISFTIIIMAQLH